MENLNNHRHKNSWVFPLVLLTFVFVYFSAWCDIYPTLEGRESQLVQWMVFSWNGGNDLLHGYAVPFLFVAFSYQAWKQVRAEVASSTWAGWFMVIIGLLLYVASVRTIQPRLALIGMPFLIAGSVSSVLGWKAGRYMLFPAFFWWFAIPVPGLNQMTNFLQVMVTQACYFVGATAGMDLIHSGNNIHSASDKWDFNIAEGCSGIRSLMALVMISAIYAYYTQKELWKKALVFGASLPLALFGNFCRVFTILILAELGYEDFAANAYHDFSGLFIFFPAALAGLFGLDRLFNPKKYKKEVRITMKGGGDV
ncbi:exosortase/archaeosortase family protein [Rubritalea marina]|uniref:exosortase/archaeosortase family protein n=1 Tax=Rubritalea marina TaxID=361055 RepID=UPI0003812308|nr:exosortase/archaeosortase family protein [Rubritalea marina]